MFEKIIEEELKQYQIRLIDYKSNPIGERWIKPKDIAKAISDKIGLELVAEGEVKTIEHAICGCIETYIKKGSANWYIDELIRKKYKGKPIQIFIKVKE